MRRNALPVLLVATLALAAGCADTSSLGAPEVRGVSSSWGEVTTDTAEVVTTVRVHNPNPVAIPLTDVETELLLNDVRLGEGSAESAEMPANTTSDVVISTEIRNEKIRDWWVTHVRNDERSTLRLNGSLVFDLTIDELRHPVERTRPVETDILGSLEADRPREISTGPLSLTLQSVDSRWGTVTRETTEIRTRATVRNDNPLPVPLTNLRYTVDMNGVRMAEGTTRDEVTLDPDAETLLRIDTELRNDRIDDWWTSHLRNDEHTDVTATLEATAEVAGETRTLTLSERETGFDTDLLGRG